MNRVCTRCVMDSSDPGVTFDAEGRCNVCTRYLEQKELRGYRAGESEKQLAQIVAAMKKAGEGREFDCVLGLSGGVDSSYMAYVAHEHGLRVLAVHVDTGWNSEMAVRNIERVCNGLGYELHTIVMDWPTMKELQRAYMFSGLANLDVPQDHLFCAAVYRFAKQYGVKYLLNGSNLATEGASAAVQRPAQLPRLLGDQERIPKARARQEPEKVHPPEPARGMVRRAWRDQGEPAGLCAV